MPPLPAPPQIAIVAGEASGDLLGSLLIKSVRAAGLDAGFHGIAGPKMQAAGARSLFPLEALSVRGYVEALGSLRKILGIRRALKKQLLAQPPRLFIGVDAPDFNLALESELKRAGIATIHFISPSIWAWRPKRIRKIARAASHVLLVFPFEEAIYQQAGIPATYVGHPLAHALPEPNRRTARERLGLAQDGEYVALLPGSRLGELQALGRLYVEAAKRIAQARPQTRFLIPLATRETRQAFERILYEADARELPLRILFGHAHDAMQAADAALIASGTATLEALLLDCPHVISYRVPWLTWQIMKRQALLPWIGLPNILADRTVVPEILQDQATAEALALAIQELLADEEARAAQIEEFRIQRARLKRDTPRLIADAISPFLA
ncbi:MAG: lipid-A-disaccharide synthase [Pseudomonadota bacterium]|nr:lipid-A-disaccharide synthase [Pseudomonadota bacterium]MDP1904872.1 lipid-A-disaccharide synthase [Pseudomonadota bacterium]MDP2354355.1 lipid-A-disaccharide synthase [Pseudomonadota bacterium]